MEIDSNRWKLIQIDENTWKPKEIDGKRENSMELNKNK